MENTFKNFPFKDFSTGTEGDANHGGIVPFMRVHECWRQIVCRCLVSSTHVLWFIPLLIRTYMLKIVFWGLNEWPVFCSNLFSCSYICNVRTDMSGDTLNRIVYERSLHTFCTSWQMFFILSWLWVLIYLCILLKNLVFLKKQILNVVTKLLIQQVTVKGSSCKWLWGMEVQVLMGCENVNLCQRFWNLHTFFSFFL